MQKIRHLLSSKILDDPKRFREEMIDLDRHWNDRKGNEEPKFDVLFQFAYHKSDRNYLNMFARLFDHDSDPDKEVESREILVGYKIGGLIGDEKVYRLSLPYGIDTYESRFIVGELWWSADEEEPLLSNLTEKHQDTGLSLPIKQIIKGVVDWLDEYLEKSKCCGFVVGVSGGVDSAVVSTLCAMTKRPLLVVDMPIYQKSDQVDRGRIHIEMLQKRFTNVSNYCIDLTSVYEEFKRVNPHCKGVSDSQYEFSLSNARSRLRMTTLYNLAGQLGYLVVGTGNKVEDFGIGFFTKYGDGGVDLSPIGDLVKTEVWLMAKELEIDSEIVNAAPTDGLHDDGRTDEEQIGATYQELEWAMRQSEPSLDWTERQGKVYEIYHRFHQINKHKFVPIPVFDTSSYR